MRALAFLVVLALALAPAAHAAFPGQNGKIAFTSDRDLGGVGRQIFVMSPNGSGITQLTSSVGDKSHPSWSPDGTKIAFANRDPSDFDPDCDDFFVMCNGEIYVMNADGTGVTRMTNTPTWDESWPKWTPDGSELTFNRSFGCDPTCPPRSNSVTLNLASGTERETGLGSIWEAAWSPDGQRVAYTRPDEDRYLYTAKTDGSDERIFCCTDRPNAWAATPDWSPNGSAIVFWDTRMIARKNLDGSGYAILRPQDAARQAEWSPDGAKMVVEEAGGIAVMNADGTGLTQVTNYGQDREPDWQPILKGYPRPKGAGTLHAPLVPAYDTCTTPNRAHAAPLSFDSCNPPTQSSTQLTVGTPDANLKPAGSVASLRIGVIPGAAGPPDDAEVNLITQVTDVRNASDLSDYTGNLEMRVPLRVTDKSNTPYPGGPGPGTAQDLMLTWNVPCTATADPNIGATCSLSTTADTLLPGSALEGRRAIWQTDQIEARDAGGNAFLRQGVFVP